MVNQSTTSNSKMKIARAILLGILGPIVAMIVTWQPPVSVAAISADETPDPGIVEGLRTVPHNSVLEELHQLAVSYPSFERMAPAEVLDIADKMLAGKYVPDGLGGPMGVPFVPRPYMFGHSGAHLDLHSFAVPSLLGRAYEISKESKYLQSAVQYIIDWDKYESSLILPRGFFFEDHPMAARSIVVTEIWRLYRDSDAYKADVATQILHYAQRLFRLLLDNRLYEYRTNHGIMQCLSLLHLAIAFPLLDVAEQGLKIGSARLESQLEYFVNSEGVILEHSPSYHWNGLNRMAAAWRYLGLNDVAVADEMVTRYKKALEFAASLRHPDGTLPVIGDTGDHSYSPYQIALFDGNSIVSDPLRTANVRDFVPSPITIAAGGGYAIFWSGLQHWPASRNLVQTVLHWGNFPTQVHKHADDLGISIWTDGTQWVRGVGYWPYIDSRREAIGWRSSNGPHFLDETHDVERSSSLVASATSDKFSFFEVIRENADGRSIRRQLVKPGADIWVVVDSFHSQDSERAETIWRFSPEVTLRTLKPAGFHLTRSDQRMSLTLHGTGALTVDADEEGREDWNSGLMSDGEIVPSPAIRIRTDDDHGAVLSVFQLHNAGVPAEFGGSIDFNWNDAADWTMHLTDHEQNEVEIRRLADSITVAGPNLARARWRLTKGPSESAVDARSHARHAYEQVAQRLGGPFNLMLERRKKVTTVVLLAAILQIAIFIAVVRQAPRWWPPLLAASSLSWLGLSLYLGLQFLA